MAGRGGTGLVAGSVLGTVAGLTYGNLPFGVDYPRPGLPARLVYGLGTGLGTGLPLVLLSTRTCPASLAFLQFAVRWRTPPRLMRFLEDARQRNVLRIIGPAYQFRHARLQDHLARQAEHR